MSRGSYAKLVGSYLCRAVAALCLCSSAFAFDAPGNLKAGWDGSLQLGALATFGAVDTNALLARTDFTYQGERWKLRDLFSIKLKYDARFNSNIVNLISTFDNDVEAALSVNLEVEVF